MNEDMRENFEKTYLEAMQNEMQSELDQIKKIGVIATGVCIGCIAGSLINYLIGPNVIIMAGALGTASLTGLLAIDCFLARKFTNKQIKKDATNMADTVSSSFEHLFANYDNAFYIDPDDDPVLQEKIALLTAYAQEVGYPGYEIDVFLTKDIMHEYLLDEITSQEITLLIKNMEQLMLDKAYKFYTGRLGRKRHLRGKLL